MVWFERNVKVCIILCLFELKEKKIKTDSSGFNLCTDPELHINTIIKINTVYICVHVFRFNVRIFIYISYKYKNLISINKLSFSKENV